MTITTLLKEKSDRKAQHAERFPIKKWSYLNILLHHMHCSRSFVMVLEWGTIVTALPRGCSVNWKLIMLHNYKEPYPHSSTGILIKCSGA